MPHASSWSCWAQLCTPKSTDLSDTSTLRNQHWFMEPTALALLYCHRFESTQSFEPSYFRKANQFFINHCAHREHKFHAAPTQLFNTQTACILHLISSHWYRRVSVYLKWHDPLILHHLMCNLLDSAPPKFIGTLSWLVMVQKQAPEKQRALKQSRIKEYHKIPSLLTFENLCTAASNIYKV